MSQNTSTENRRRTAVGVGVAAGAAVAAALIGLGTAGTAGADDGGAVPTSTDHDPYSDLFGSENASDPTSIGGHDAALDTALYQGNPALATQFDTVVDEFESSQDHPFADFVNAFDPNAFTTQVDPDVVTSSGAELPYLVPTDGLGYFATVSDFELTGTGLTFVLDPAVNFFADSGLF